MNFSKNLTSFLCFFFATLALAQMCHAQNSPQDYVNAHNDARAAVGVGNIQWDDQVAAFAQQYADQRKGDCVLQHSGGGGRYGENLAGGSGPGLVLTATTAVQMWVAEKADYDYNSNTCASGKVCGHYTQVVWRDSVRLGCARVQCDNGGIFVTCNYDPPGNFVGQKPY
ncbi:pathogenesis-related protein PR-1 type [Beta vulgaris subsp. vulgaris]|uniref:pathogenesis-related protein PR-1 type n=1 Tax=Beta vulgaris subsp. vulgaris TaxID=3555 RepID=UPI0020375D47|nr:pathogenesis-related protein PR-1 type [Beta vulgaris subsp. vulgaris]